MVFQKFNIENCTVESYISSDYMGIRAGNVNKFHLHVRYIRENVYDMDVIIPVLRIKFYVPNWTTPPNTGHLTNDNSILIDIERNSIIINNNEYDILELSLLRGAIDIRKIMPYTGISFKL